MYILIYQMIDCIAATLQIAHIGPRCSEGGVNGEITSSSAIARDRAAGWVSYGQKWMTVTARQYFTDISHIIGLSLTTVT